MIRRSLRVLTRIRSEPRPVRFLLSRILWRSGLCRLLTIDLGYGRLHFAPTAMSATLWIDPRSRETDTIFFESVLRPGDVAIDVGANIGSLTILASRLVGSSGHVYAVEPNPRTYSFLMGNLRLNATRNVTAFSAAAGAIDGSANLVSGRSDDQDRIGDRGTPVSVRTLDAIVGADARSVRLLKIDVEGFESFVLQGATGILSRTEFVYLETGDELSLRYGYSTHDLLDDVRARGFDIFTVAGHGDLLPLDDRFDTVEPGNVVARARARSLN